MGSVLCMKGTSLDRSSTSGWVLLANSIKHNRRRFVDLEAVVAVSFGAQKNVYWRILMLQSMVGAVR